MAYTKYSLTPANNNAAPPDGAPEGMLPSAVNDTMRDMMAQIRDCGDGIRGGTYTMTAPVITGGSISGASVSATSLTDSGNLTFTGTGNRITGDFSNATIASRVIFQTSTTNGDTILTSIPNGTSTRTDLHLYNAVDAANAFYAGISATSTDMRLVAGVRGTGTYLPLTMYTNGSERLRIDTSGNVGIGGTPIYKLDVYDAATAISATRGNATTQQIIQRSSTDASAPIYQFYKSRGTVASSTIVSSSDITGRAIFYGYDGASFIPTAEIRSVVDGTPGTNDMPGRLVFYTTADGASVTTERMRITSDGVLCVGQTAGGLQTTQSFSYQGSGDGAFSVSHSTANVSGDHYLRFGYNGTQIGSISQNGTTAVAYNTSSDYRLKENIAPMTGALAKVAQLKPVTYTWKTDGSDGQGFIAHELSEVCPDAVTGEKDAVDEDGNPKYQGIDVSFLVATLTAAIKEQQVMIEELKAKVAALEAA